DGGDIVWLVMRGERFECRQLFDDLMGQAARGRESGAAMHDAMADPGERAAVAAAVEPPQDNGEGGGMRRNRRQGATRLFDPERMASGVGGGEAWSGADRGDLASTTESEIGVAIRNLVYGELQARRAGVQDQQALRRACRHLRPRPGAGSATPTLI